MKKSLLYCFLIFCLVSTQGCFDIKREIKIFPNGSGEEKISVTVESSVADILKTYAAEDKTGKGQKILNFLMNNDLLQSELTVDMQKMPGISLKEVQISPKDNGSKEILIRYTFDAPATLVRVVKETTNFLSNEQNVSFTLLKFFDEGDAVRFRYLLRNASRGYDDSLALNLFSSLLQSKRVYFSIDMPFEVQSSNALYQTGNALNWDFPISDILYSQAEMTAVMKRETGLDLPFAEKIDKTTEAVSKSKNPLVRIVLYNANKEEVKNGTGIVLKDGLAVTNYRLMTIMEGQGYFSIKLPNDSLAGVDEMRETDYEKKSDIVFFRFNNMDPAKTLRLAPLSDVSVTQKVKIYYFPNTLGGTAYSMDGTVSGIKSWGKTNKIIEVKPTKPLGIEGGAVFTENGDLVGMITIAYSGEVGKLYVVPSDYIRAKLAGAK
jgi:trypsin-like peptidase